MSSRSYFIHKVSERLDILEEYDAVTAEIFRLERLLARARDRQATLRHALVEGEMAPHDPGTLNGASAGLAQVADLVNTQPREIDATTVARILGITLDAARARLQRATQGKLIRRVSHGLYAAITTDGT
jgi:hypothetical protein